MATIKIPQVFQLYTGGSALLTVEGTTLTAVLRDLAQRYPELATHLMNRTGKLHQYVHLFRKGEELPRVEADQVLISQDDDLVLVPGIAGG